MRSDENRYTVTVSQRKASSLQKALKDAGIKSLPLSLRGRFHCSCHQTALPSLLAFCDSHPLFQFLDASNLVLSLRDSSVGELVKTGALHHIALQAILLDRSKWYETFSAMSVSLPINEDTFIVSVGSERCIPPSVPRKLKANFVNTSNLVDIETGSETRRQSRSENDIAVVGMSIKVPGANDLEEFWDLLCAAKSQHKELPHDRVPPETIWRDQDPNKKFFGNFLDEIDAFDHKFFKKSPREMASTDPQQRLMLQNAYQALEQGGYFSSPSPEKHVGYYVGICATDYENNIFCHPANAFSVTGNLRAFVAGKVSHYFGWTGPSFTIDTACSSSAVAIHQACKALLTGECNAAVASGVNVLSNHLWFQNLVAASFLSPTGQCKPFDEKADGYCRAEGLGSVYLKTLNQAIADGDQIKGVISSTGVLQNQNCSSIFVPNSPSLSDLFRKVVKDADMQPKHITYAEAHGTGTPVGDPVEYESIREVLAGSNTRAKSLPFGSVKGLTGHAESASGIISLVKTLLMIQKKMIPTQASFNKMNPNIKTTPTDNMEVVTSPRKWDEDFRATLINNYGAAGSNASMIVAQSPYEKPQASRKVNGTTPTHGSRYPFWLSGLDDRSLKAYASKLLQVLRSKDSVQDYNVENLSFNLSRQSNRNLSRALQFSIGSIRELEDALSAFEKADDSMTSIEVPSTPPVILCFGGQVSTFVGLESDVFEKCRILRLHLDQCDALCQDMGFKSIYPGIFQKSPIEDTVELQTVLFSMQYSCAKAWIDSGIQPAAVVGHSFGELTAVCISGILSLEDALKMVLSRARIIQKLWGPDSGAMLAVEGDQADVERLLVDSRAAEPSEEAATIACHNAPRSFTVAGSTKAVQAVYEIASQKYGTMRKKMLNVTNAFHSTLVQPLMGALEESARNLQFHEPSVRYERATEAAFEDKLGASFVPEHMRNPVFFRHAVQRLSNRFPNAVWLEAGSNSTITAMAGKALDGPSKSSRFQGVNITKEGALSSLADTTVKLWKEGVKVSFLSHHCTQVSEYSALVLPPYQFEKTRHWLEVKKPPKITEDNGAAATTTTLHSNELVTFASYLDKEERSAKFNINTSHEKFTTLVSGHVVAQTAPLCPAPLLVDMATKAILGLHPELKASDLQPQLRNLENQSPMCIDPSRNVWLEMQTTDADARTWNWKFMSNGVSDRPGTTPTTHAAASTLFVASGDETLQQDFARFERLVGHARCRKLLDDNGAPHIMQGPLIYKTFADVVDYTKMYQGMKKLVGFRNESAGRIMKPDAKDWLDILLSDSFCHVIGVFVNHMSDRADTDLCLAGGCESWIKSPNLKAGDDEPEYYDAFASHSQVTDKLWVSDLFIFNPHNGVLLEVLLGVRFIKLPKLGMGRLLSKLSPGAKAPAQPAQPPKPSVSEKSAPPAGPANSTSEKPQGQAKPQSKGGRGSQRAHVLSTLKEVLGGLSGLEPHEIGDTAELADIGIDSLMGMEMAKEVQDTFKISVEMDELAEIVDLPGSVDCVVKHLGASGEDDSDETEDDSKETNETPEKVQSVQTSIKEPPPTTNGEVKQVNGVNGHADDAEKYHLAHASESRYDPTSEPPKPAKEQIPADTAARQAVVDEFVRKTAADFQAPISATNQQSSPRCPPPSVLITGATGSLGAHLVAHLATLDQVKSVVCVNRRTDSNAELRQREAMQSRGIQLDEKYLSKLRVLETDTSKANLGLSPETYKDLCQNVTHIIHNAWPMSSKRPVAGFAGQFHVLRHLLNFARDIVSYRPSGFKPTFQFISSIATVGYYPIRTGNRHVPEQRVGVADVLPNGYGDAKFTCEQILDATLHQYPESFRTMVVRLGQVAGSRTSGYWNPMEHLSFLVKSSQTLQALPELRGELSWTPVNDVAATLADVVLLPEDKRPYPVYHIDNPVRQYWEDMLPVLADEMGVPKGNIIPFDEWVARVREFPGSVDDNPALKLAEFLDDNFLRMACGGLLLRTENCCEHSKTLASTGPVSDEVARGFVRAWKEMGFLS